MRATVPERLSNYLQMIRNAYKPAICHLKFVQTTKIDQNSSFWPFLDRYRIFSVRKYPISVCNYPDCSGSTCKRSGTPENLPKPTSTAFVRPKLTKIAQFWPILTVIGYVVRTYPISVIKYPDRSGSVFKRSGAPENIPKPTSTAFIRPKLIQTAHFCVFDRYRIF
jgi:hypothetical protein